MAGILGLLGLGGGSQPAAAGVKPTDDWFAQFNPANQSQNGGINPNPGTVIGTPPPGTVPFGPGHDMPAPTETGQPSYADFQRDYWAPDREQVLAGMTPPPITGMPVPNPNQPPPMTDKQKHWANNPAYGYTPPTGKPMSWEGVPVGNPGGLLGSLGLGELASGGKPQSIAQTLIKMRTPHGTVAHVPTSQIEEALRRGATQV